MWKKWVECLVGSLGSKIDNCFCGIKQEILTNRYENALATSSINATTVSQTQKILDAIAQNDYNKIIGNDENTYAKFADAWFNDIDGKENKTFDYFMK